MAKGDNKEVLARAKAGADQAKGQYDQFINKSTSNANDVYKQFKDTGGLDQADIDKMRGYYDNLKGPDFSKVNEGYTNLADTGGYSDKDISNVRARSASSAPAYFDAIKRNSDQARQITGNVAGQGAINFKLARQQAQQANQDRVNTELGLSDSIREGKLAGLGGLYNTANSTSQFGLSKAAGQAGVDKDIMGMKQSGREFGAGALLDNDKLTLGALGSKFGTDNAYLQALLQGKGKGINWGAIASGAGAGLALL